MTAVRAVASFLSDRWLTLYAVPAVLLLAVLIVLTARGAKPGADPCRRDRTDVFLGLAGLLLLGASFSAGMILTGRENGTGDWARDTFLLYYKAAVPILCVLVSVFAASSLGAHASPKLKKGLFPRFRVWANAAASALFLLATPAYAALTVNRYVPIHLLILLSGTGAALTFRLLLPLEYRARRENPSVDPQKGNFR